MNSAPEIRNHYCTTVCPLGNEMPKAEVVDLDRICVKVLSSFRKLDKTKELLLDITEDGVVSEDEKADLQEVLKSLEELEGIAQNLRIWVKKNL